MRSTDGDKYEHKRIKKSRAPPSLHPLMCAQLRTPTLYEVRPPSAHPTVTELDCFQALLQQRGILCRDPPYMVGESTGGSESQTLQT